MKASLIAQVDRPIRRLLQFDYMTWAKFSRQNISDRVLPLSEGPGVKNLCYLKGLLIYLRTWFFNQVVYKSGVSGGNRPC